MPRYIAAGLDGSAESLAAATWAANEAVLRGLPLRLIHVWEPVPYGYLPLSGTQPEPPDRVVESTAERLQKEHPALRVEPQELSDHPITVLTDVAEQSEMLVLGSRGLGGITGFLVGSVSLGVVARASRPVVLIRANESGQQAAVGTESPGTESPDADASEPDRSAHPTRPAGSQDASAATGGAGSPAGAGTGSGPGAPSGEQGGRPGGADAARPEVRNVVLGLKLEQSHESCVGFAFDAARRRGAVLRVVHTWNFPPIYGYAAGEISPDLLEDQARQEGRLVEEALAPWRQKYPEVEIAQSIESGRAGHHLVAASAQAQLVVVGRRTRHSLIGSHLGPVVHSVIHHCAAPAAIVPRS